MQLVVYAVVSEINGPTNIKSNSDLLITQLITLNFGS